MDEMPQYDYVLSHRLNRTSSQEQYAFIYRKAFRLLDYYVIGDPYNLFEREPFFVTFMVDSYIFDIAQTHIKPENAEKGVAAFLKVKTSTKQIWLGDFNADCGYYDKFLSERFDWIIKDKEDTTVDDTDCTYDRIVVTYPITDRIRGIWVNTLDEYNYSFQLKISDHFPVSIKLEIPSVNCNHVTFGKYMGNFSALL